MTTIGRRIDQVVGLPFPNSSKITAAREVVFRTYFEVRQGPSWLVNTDTGGICALLASIPITTARDTASEVDANGAEVPAQS